MPVNRRHGWPPPKKSLGQVMLVDASVAREIVGALNLSENHNVLEIGAGRGILTSFLLESGAETICCEIDERMSVVLQHRFGGYPNFSLISGDILKLDLNSIFLDESFGTVGNLPYHLTSEILFKFFNYVRLAWDKGGSPRTEYLAVMVQRELAERLLSSPGTRGWGVLSVYTSLFGEIEKVAEVSRDSFKPAPMVDSTVVKITFREGYPFEIEDYGLFRKLIKKSFGNRRKMLRNSLERFGIPDDSESNLGRRPEELTAADFAALAAKIGKNEKYDHEKD